MNSPVILFGLPGAGKTYVGELFRDTFGYHLHDGDSDIQHEMKERIDQGLPVTDAMRDVFFARLIAHSRTIHQQHPKLVITQTFIKERYRIQCKTEFPEALFILIQASQTIREQRIAQRSTYRLDPEYARTMATTFEPPKLPHHVIENNNDGTIHLLAQLQTLLV